MAWSIAPFANVDAVPEHQLMSTDQFCSSWIFWHIHDYVSFAVAYIIAYFLSHHVIATYEFADTLACQRFLRVFVTSSLPVRFLCLDQGILVAQSRICRPVPPHVFDPGIFWHIYYLQKKNHAHFLGNDEYADLVQSNKFIHWWRYDRVGLERSSFENHKSVTKGTNAPVICHNRQQVPVWISFDPFLNFIWSVLNKITPGGRQRSNPTR